MCCNLYDAHTDGPASVTPQNALAGTLVSSLHRLKDVDNSGQFWRPRVTLILGICLRDRLTDGGFFVFGDLSVKIEGEFRLLFSLFEMLKYDLLLGFRRN